MQIRQKKNNTRDIIRREVIKATSRIYGAKNYARWGSFKVYPQQIESIWKRAYKQLAESHPKMGWLQTLMNTQSKDIQLKLVLQIPDKDIEIVLPDKDRKLGAIAHAGGLPLLVELLEIIQDMKPTLNETFEQATEIMNKSLDNKL